MGFTGCEVCEKLCGLHEISCRVLEIPHGAEAVLSSLLAARGLPPHTLFRPPKGADSYFPLLLVSGLAPVYGDGS